MRSAYNVLKLVLKNYQGLLRSVMNKQIKHFYEFGEFRLELSRRKFYQGGTVVPLTPKVFDLLVVLLQNQGRVLEKRYLLDEVWSDVIVEEHSLTQAISVLRKIVGDKQNNHNYIMTIPARGYQFIAPVKEVIEEDEGGMISEQIDALPQTRRVWSEKRGLVPIFFTRTLARRSYFAATFLLIGIFAGILPPWLSSNANRISSQGRAQLTAIAVKPFHSADKESCKTGLSGTVTDAVVTKLSQLEGVAVRPIEHSCSNKAHAKPAHSSASTTSESPAKIASETSLEAMPNLKVDAVIEGQVQKYAETFRVSVRLIRASDGVALWADQVEAVYPNDGSMQDRIAGLVAQAVLTKLSL